MALITNPKIGYRRFAGYSILFDNPGDENYVAHAGRLQLVQNRPGANPFMDAATAGMTAIGEGVWEQHGLLQLNPKSYHVTLWDGINHGNVQNVSEPHRLEAINFLHGIPFSIRSGKQMMRDAADSPLAAWRGDMRYVFDRLAIIADYVLVILLKPADDRYAAVQRSVEHLRDDLYQIYDAHYGIGSAGSYMPHLSLGYFLRHADGRHSLDFVRLWNERLKEAFAERDHPQLGFQSASLYGFTDMENFYRVNEAATVGVSTAPGSAA